MGAPRSRFIPTRSWMAATVALVMGAGVLSGAGVARAEAATAPSATAQASAGPLWAVGLRAGVGGISNQVPISLRGLRPSRRHPLRVGLFGDSMVYVAAPGLSAALESTHVMTVANYSFPGWGTSTFPGWRTSFAAAIRKNRSQLVIGTWAWDQSAAYKHPTQYAQTLRLLVRTATAAGARGVIILGYPAVVPPPGSSASQTGQAVRVQSTWQRLVAQLPHQMPGKAMFFPIAPSVELNGQAVSWLPPPARPGATASRWKRVRRLDGVHLCDPGIILYATALSRDLSHALRLPRATLRWVSGSWTKSPVLTTAAQFCPNDHPPA